MQLLPRPRPQPSLPPLLHLRRTRKRLREASRPGDEDVSVSRSGRHQPLTPTLTAACSRGHQRAKRRSSNVRSDGALVRAISFPARTPARACDSLLTPAPTALYRLRPQLAVAMAHRMG
jgi:hypothetical protein